MGPVFSIPQNQDWDKYDDHIKAWKAWKTYFANIHEYWTTSDSSFIFHKQETHDNFVMLYKNVLYIAIRNRWDDDPKNNIFANYINWLEQQLSDFDGKFSDVIILGQEIERNSMLYKYLDK